MQTQIETGYFLSALTVGPYLLWRLFLMGLPMALVGVPLAVWLLGRWRAPAHVPPAPAPHRPGRVWLRQLVVLVVAYELLYFGAGYFIAWQNPELRAFYGQPGEALPLRGHLAQTLRNDPMLFLLQALRALAWVACAWPILRGSRWSRAWTALLVGVFFSAPQNVVHVLANPLMPLASVRWSHMVETASSTFVFGLLVAWLLLPRRTAHLPVKRS